MRTRGEFNLTATCVVLNLGCRSAAPAAVGVVPLRVGSTNNRSRREGKAMCVALNQSNKRAGACNHRCISFNPPSHSVTQAL